MISKQTTSMKTKTKEKNNPGGNLAKENIDELVEKYQPALKSFIRKRVTRKEDEEDILQDAFYQLVKTVNSVLNPIDNVLAWLYKVSRNLIINKRTKKKEDNFPVYYDDDGNSSVFDDFSEILFSDEAYAPSPEMEYLRSLVWNELENALSELPPEQREIFELTELNGIPVKEISETTGIPVNPLLSRKHYAILHLRERLTDLYQDIINS
jgi:RNA polymerase sigma factor (sigma-70 family)